MARTPSTMLALGTPMPDFRLDDTVSGQPVSPAALRDQPVLVMFICNHCPFVIHLRAELVALCNAAVERGLAVVAINANDRATHPQDGPEHMATLARQEAWRFPYCFDESQEMAMAFTAACTPDFFLFDAQHTLAYRGQLDDSRPGSGIPVTGADLSAAIDAVLAGQSPSSDQKPSLGCNIKWKSGNAPSDFS